MNAITEDVARVRLCPLAIAGAKSIECVASLCMAWRWQTSTTRELAAGSTKRAPAYIDTIKHERGYCGLAGRIRT